MDRFSMPFGGIGTIAKIQLPFSIFLRSGRRYYSVSFKNETTGEYLPAGQRHLKTNPSKCDINVI
jgi:hypothetical protein